jgi:hypothetical protein
MKPSQVAGALRHIASKIQNSKNPDRKLVAQDLQRILVAIDTGRDPQWCKQHLKEIYDNCNEDLKGSGEPPLTNEEKTTIKNHVEKKGLANQSDMLPLVRPQKDWGYSDADLKKAGIHTSL